MDATQQRGSSDVSLRTLFPTARLINAADILVSRCTTNPLQCSPGDVLVAGMDELPADESAARGIAGGIKAVVTEQLLPVPLPQCIVPDARVAFAQLTSELAGNPSQQTLSIGVAGVHGKTSTALLIATVLRHAGLRVAYHCDLGCSDGVVQSVPKTSLTDAREITQWYAEANDAGCQACVIELSESLLRNHAVDGTSFDMIVIPDDCDHATLPQAQGTSVYSEALSRLNRQGVAIVNSRNETACRAAEAAGVTCVTFGTCDQADIVGQIVERNLGETTYVLRIGDVTSGVRTRLTGDWMVNHQLAAAATAMLLDFPQQAIVKGLQSLEKIPGRMQRVGSFTGPQVVIDDAATPAQIMATMNALRKELPRGGKLSCVVACGPEHRPELAANIGYIAERCSDQLVITSDVHGSKDFLSHVHDMLDGLVRPEGPPLIANRETAITWAIQKAKPSDMVVIFSGYASQSPHARRSLNQSDFNFVVEALKQIETPQRQPDCEAVILPHPTLLKMRSKDYIAD
ncbi:MAG: Mur ligase family protein [Pirellulaceae bacterium]